MGKVSAAAYGWFAQLPTIVRLSCHVSDEWWPPLRPPHAARVARRRATLPAPPRAARDARRRAFRCRQRPAMASHACGAAGAAAPAERVAEAKLLLRDRAPLPPAQLPPLRPGGSTAASWQLTGEDRPRDAARNRDWFGVVRRVQESDGGGGGVRDADAARSLERVAPAVSIAARTRPTWTWWRRPRRVLETP